MIGELEFRAIDVGDGTDGQWRSWVMPNWPSMLRDAEEDARTQTGAARARRRIETHMPELVGVLDRLAEAVDRPEAASILAQTRIPPTWPACSQTVVDGVLLRNYDFPPEFCERTVMLSNFLRPVIGMGEDLWGLLDGMNDAGLAVSLTFGGRFGFDAERPGVLLVLRYLLETCTSVEEAWTVLRRLPVATVQNLTLADAEQAASVYVGPDIAAERADHVCVTNHQREEVSAEFEAGSATGRRWAALSEATAAADGSVESVLAALLRPPLYVTTADGTLYTAAYRPAEGRVDYHWPGLRRTQTFDAFEPGTWTAYVGQPLAPTAAPV